MKSIRIGNHFINVKDYYCSQGQDYIPREDGKLWLYVNITDICPASCPFCVNPGRKSGTTPFAIENFCETLKKIKQYVYGVSFTGGEPMLEPLLLDQAVKSAYQIMGSSVELDMVTNGINLEVLPSLHFINYLDSIHLSRHLISDQENSDLMGFSSPTWKQIKECIDVLEDPVRIVLNCILQKGGIDNLEKMSLYLENAADVGVRNVSFIGMIGANEYCYEHYVDPESIHVGEDDRFRIWNQFHDHDYCRCCSGDFRAKDRWIRFYYRVPGPKRASYARQLVYTSDNRLLCGFGGEEVVLRSEDKYGP